MLTGKSWVFQVFQAFQQIHSIKPDDIVLLGATPYFVYLTYLTWKWMKLTVMHSHDIFSNECEDLINV